MRFKYLNIIVMLVLLFCFLTAAASQAREITLKWDPNSEPDISHYIVYWGTESGVYTSRTSKEEIGLNTEYKINLPDDGQIYYFAVTAVDTSNLESDYSNEVKSPDAIDDYLYLPPSKPSNVKRAIYQETLPDGSIAVFQGDTIKITRPDNTVIEINGDMTN